MQSPYVRLRPAVCRTVTYGLAQVCSIRRSLLRAVAGRVFGEALREVGAAGIVRHACLPRWAQYVRSR